jgi:tetratricopeptide (TPR) repeat protein
MRRRALLALCGLTLLTPLKPATLRADVIYLKDGTRIEGEIVRKSDAGWDVKGPDGTITTVPSGRVRSFEAKRGNAADDPAERLASLRRSAGGQADIPKILERYKTFIEQYAGTPIVEEAKRDVKQWEERLAKGMVKVGDRWVTREEQATLRAKGVEQAVAARKLLLQGRVKDATAAIDAALADDPQNAAALYLRGVALYRQEQTAGARKAFEAVTKLAPNHGPALNNLAVIQWGAKQLPGAMNLYGQAMNASPGTRVILDNVAEALNELPEPQRRNAVTEKVVLMFNAQDMALQGRMKKRGLFRWGSTWVEERELKQLESEEEQIEEKLDVLEDEFEQAKERIEQIDRDLADTERSIRRIEASSYGRDRSGRPVRVAYPRLYYDLKRDVENLHDERGAEKEKLERLRKKARQVQQELTVPRYTGVQQLIGVEGTPDLPALTQSDLEAAPAPEPESEPEPAPEPVRDADDAPTAE